MELWQLRQMQSLPLEVKIEKALLRIKEWYEYWDGKVYVSFSGGKDSTVLLHLVRSIYPEVPALFVDTGMEFPEIREFVSTASNIVCVRPERHFTDVIREYGYPVVSKEQANYIHRVRHSKSEHVKRKAMEGIERDGRKTRFKISEKWKYLVDAPFEISDYCCSAIKKAPVKRYEKRTGEYPFIGTMAHESTLRTTVYLKSGCNAFDAKRPVSTPLAFWLEQDIWDYIRKFDVPYSKIYDMGYDRTGCMFCMFGVHLEPQPNRFQRMKVTHPQLYKYCMDKLGLREVLQYLKVPFE